jgi:hypothetical protein
LPRQATEEEKVPKKMNKNEDENKIEDANPETPAAPTVADEMAPLKAASAGEKKQERGETPFQNRGARYRPVTHIEAAGVVILALYTIASYLQWQALSTTNDLTRESNETTKQVAAANQKLMAESNELTRLAIAGNFRSAAQAQRQADIGERSLRVQNRAFLRMTEIEPYELVAGRSGEAIAKIANTGKVGAGFTVHPTVEVIARSASMSWTIDPKARNVERYVGASGSASSAIPIPALDADVITAIKDPKGAKSLCIIGWIYYMDEVDNADTGNFCWCWEEGQKWSECGDAG